ncbi:hypothetical protein Unana1_02271 [Umbelopsis nana]
MSSIAKEDTNHLSEEAPSVVTKDSETEHDYDPSIARRLLWKIDLWILPMLSLIYFFASMDRSDIANAQLAGMQKAINASDSDWTEVVSFFYLGYIVSQPIGTLFLRAFTPPRILGFSVLVWGVLTICLTTVRSASQAIGVRICIGATEGLVQAAPFYLSLWYRPTELATRGSIFFSVSSIAAAFNGLIAYGLETNFTNKPPFEPWQWLFLIEGIISTAFGFIVFILLPPVPERVKFGFTKEEKIIAMKRSKENHNTLNAVIRPEQILLTFKQPLLYLYIVIYACVTASLASLQNFLPIIIQGMGYTSVNAQLMSVPVNGLAFISTIFFGYLSDRLQKRGSLLLVLSAIAMAGYIMLLAERNSQPVRYAATCLVAIGIYPCVTIALTWLNVNIIGYTRRAVTLASVNMLGDAFTLVVTLLFNTPPLYILGNAFVLGTVAVLFVSTATAMLLMSRLNKAKAAIASTAEAALLREKSIEEIGNDHPDFYYTI